MEGKNSSRFAGMAGTCRRRGQFSVMPRTELSGIHGIGGRRVLGMTFPWTDWNLLLVVRLLDPLENQVEVGDALANEFQLALDSLQAGLDRRVVGGDILLAVGEALETGLDGCAVAVDLVLDQLHLAIERVLDVGAVGGIGVCVAVHQSVGLQHVHDSVLLLFKHTQEAVVQQTNAVRNVREVVVDGCDGSFEVDLCE